MRLLLACLIACSAACADCSVPEVVPELRRVNPRVMRSGQPSPSSWSRLSDLGVTDVIKLNFDDEGLDTGAPSAGIAVHHVPLQPSTRLGIGLVEDVFAEPDQSTLEEIRHILSRMIDSPTRTWLVHCTNGQDRTGLVVGMIRVAVDGWGKRRAWQEMLDLGYHPELLGLDHAWWSFQP